MIVSFHIAYLCRFSVYSGFGLDRFTAYSGFGLGRFSVYSGFGLDRFHCVFLTLIPKANRNMERHYHRFTAKSNKMVKEQNKPE
jgi:hypothetical protein